MTRKGFMPPHSITLEAPLSAGRLSDILRANTLQNALTFRALLRQRPNPLAGKPFCGSVTDAGFTLTASDWRDKGRSFAPGFYERFDKLSEGTRIILNIRPFSFVASFLSVWRWAAAICFTIFLCLWLAGRASVLFPCAGVLLMLTGILIPNILLNLFSKSPLEKLKHLCACQFNELTA